MNTPLHPDAPAALLFAGALALAACAGEKPPPPAAPGVTMMQPEEPILPEEPTLSDDTTYPPNTTTAMNVRIGPEIVRACDLPEDDSYFTFDSTRLIDSDFPQLHALAACFASGPLAGRSFSVVGHSDPRGAPDYRTTLGQARANAVEAYLEEHGVPLGLGATSSRGSLDATGLDEAGWAHDRRVDVTLR